MKDTNYTIQEDDIGHCDLCASNREKPNGKTILINTTHHGYMSICENHLIESSEKMQEIKNHG